MLCTKIVNSDSGEDDDDFVVNLDVIDYTFNCAWTRTPPTAITFGIYAFIVPTLACFGLCANFINAIVFMRPKMTPSAFSYLAALAWMDCISCLLITFTALSRSVFFGNNFWLYYDFQWQTALFGITTGAANLILACVSLDRLIYLWSGSPNGAPRFCRRKIARRMICVVVLFSALVNLPYFFIFVVNEDGTFQTTPFFHSNYYRFHNWLTFSLLALVPAIFLLLGNAAIIIAFRRWAKQRKLCEKSSSKCANKNLPKERKRYQHQTKLTITIIIVITLYMFGELPAHLTSRKSALNLLFGGDISKVNFNVMQKYEIIFMTLNALQLSMNIIVYAVINPCFMPEFFVCLRAASDACFRFLGITTILNSWQRYRAGVKTKSATKMSEDHSETSEKSCDWRLDHGRRQRRCAINSWGDQISCSDDVDDMCRHGEVELRKNSLFIVSERVHSSGEIVDSSWYHSLRADWVWKRSSSLTDFSFFNYAISKESLAHVITLENSENKNTIKKRHSLAM